MIKKSILIANLFFAIVSFAQSSAEMNLKGKVKSIEEKYERCPAEAVSGVPFKCFEKENSYEFDKEGFVLKPQKETSNDYIIEKTKTKEGYVLTQYLERDGVKRKSLEKYFNKKGFNVKAIYFLGNGEITDICEFFYNKRGKKIAQKETNIWNGKTKIHHRFFNEQGDIVLSKLYENEKLIKEDITKILYEFDKKGNWVSKTIQGDYNEFYKRTITYY